MSKNTSVYLGATFDAYVNKKIKSGLYNSTSEVIRAGLRKMKEEDDARTLLLKELKEATESGEVDFNPKTYFKNFKKEYAKKKALQTKQPRTKTAR